MAPVGSRDGLVLLVAGDVAGTLVCCFVGEMDVLWQQLLPVGPVVRHCGDLFILVRVRGVQSI